MNNQQKGRKKDLNSKVRKKEVCKEEEEKRTRIEETKARTPPNLLGKARKIA